MATSNISYRINYSDQGRRSTGGIPNTTGALDTFFVIDPLVTNYSSRKQEINGVRIAPKGLGGTGEQDGGLTMTGYRNPVYGEHLWTNLLRLLEHFASPTKPVNPVLGQLWFDKSSEVGSLKLCTDPGTDTVAYPPPYVPVAPTWTPVSTRIIVSETAPITQSQVGDSIFWHNPTNMGLFYWDPTAVSINVTASPPYTSTDWTGPTVDAGTGDAPTLHPRQVDKWINILYHQYASTLEYNTILGKFAGVSGISLPVASGDLDKDWVALIQYFRTLGSSKGVDVSSLVDTTFRVYATDRFGMSLLDQYFIALDTVTAAIRATYP